MGYIKQIWCTNWRMKYVGNDSVADATLFYNFLFCSNTIMFIVFSPLVYFGTSIFKTYNLICIS